MITRRRAHRIMTLVLSLAMLTVSVNALLTFTVNRPGNVQIVTPGSIALIAVFKDAALTLNLTTVDYPQTQPFNGLLPSVQSVWVKNIHTTPVAVTVTMTGLPAGTSFTSLTRSIPVGSAAALGTLNITMTSTATVGIAAFTVVFSATA